MSKLQQDFEDYFGFSHDMSKYNTGIYLNIDTYHLYCGWKIAHNKYSQDNQKYIDLLKDIYYSGYYSKTRDFDVEIEKVLGDLL